LPNAKSARSKIDVIDQEILKLLAERFGLAREVGASKKAQAKAAGLKKPAIYVPEREEQVYRRLHKLADQEKLPWGLVQAVFADVISLCRAVQGQMTAHVLGPSGTHSEWAARANFGSGIILKFHNTIPQAIKAAEQAVDLGDPNAVAVVPIENSLEGTVTSTVDAMTATSLKLVGEGYYRVRHALFSKSKTLSEIKTIYSHPMALAQCSRWIQENLPNAKLVQVASTAEAAHNLKRGAGAIANPYLALELKPPLVIDNIHDSVENTTRFGILGAREPEPADPVVGDKTSLVFSLPNKVGSLFDAIQLFSKSGLNMTKIESRPHRGLQWEYLFYIDIDGHAADPKVAKVLKAFGGKVRNFKILGAYPKGHLWN
jgi:chorismate mutase/prephenate dehydratase